MRRFVLLLAASWAAALIADPASAPHRTPSRAPAPPLDFSGVWEIDEKASVNVPTQMLGAVLAVTQKGNRIWISPRAASEKGSPVMAEEIVADGRPYEKSLGPAGKGIVTARWADDGSALWIDVQAGSDPEPQKNASQRSIWKLSQDRKVWVRESVSISQGTPRQARLVFRKRAGAVAPSPAPKPAAGAARTPRPAPTP